MSDILEMIIYNLLCRILIILLRLLIMSKGL